MSAEDEDRMGGRLRFRDHKARFMVFSLIPTVLLLIVIEGVLTVMGIPYTYRDLHRPLFSPGKDGKVRTKPFFVFEENAAQAGAFFEEFSAEKSPGVMRIAAMGGSSVVLLGSLDLLKQTLENLPDNRKALADAGFPNGVEVINFGICGCGIGRAENAVKEALRYDVNAILIYSGHNEFSDHSKARSYRESNWLRKNSRLLQMVGKPVWLPEPGRFYMEEEKEEVYKDFEATLRRIAKLAASEGIPLVIGTMAINLRAPLKAFHWGGYDTRGVDRTPEDLHQEGLRLFEMGDFEEARGAFEKGVAASPRPRRATWKTNWIIRNTARELGVPLADVEAVVNQQAPHGIPGDELFDDYVHLNYRGRVLLQIEYGRALGEALRSGGAP